MKIGNVSFMSFQGVQMIELLQHFEVCRLCSHCFLVVRCCYIVFDRLDVCTRIFGSIRSRCAECEYGLWLVQVGNRIIQKRLHVRIEHVQPSRCREEFLERRKSNDVKKAEAKKRGETVDLKRQPAGRMPGFDLDSSTLETVTPIPCDVVNDLKGGY